MRGLPNGAVSIRCSATRVKSRAITVDYRHMRDSGPHPEPDVIASYCRGQVNSDLVVDIETHLKQCPQCRRAITVQVRREFAEEQKPLGRSGLSAA